MPKIIPGIMSGNSIKMYKNSLNLKS